MAATIQDTSMGTGGIAALLNVAAPLLLGSGKKTSTSTSTSTVDPNLAALLQGIVGQAVTNTNDPKATEGLVNDIMRRAAIAFTPALGQAARSGLYNSSTIDRLAAENTATATAAASKAVLDYKTSQQQIATSGATSLLNATRGVTSTETQQQAPTVSPNISSLLGLGLAGYQAYTQRDKIFKLLGIGGDTAGAAGAGAVGADLPLPPDFISEAGASALAGNPVTESLGSIPLPPAFVPESYATGGATGAPDLVNLFTSDATSGAASDASAGVNNLADNVDFTSILDAIGSGANDIGNFLSGVGTSIGDTFDSFLNLFGI